MATRLQAPIPLPDPRSLEASVAYDMVGEDYLTYADGETDRLFDFSSQYGFADRHIWNRIDGALQDLRAQGRQDLRILDAGCGPGTWLVRAVARAHALGFHRIKARGFDISPEMIRLAREAAAFKGNFHFEVADLTKPLPEADDSVDLCLCLYGVLNHLSRDGHEGVAAELVRVTSGHLFVTVRTVGSLPTIYVDAIGKARHFSQDHQTDRFDVDFADGRHLSFTSHLFTAAEFKGLFSSLAPIASLTGLDVFHSRFASDPRWNPAQLPYAEVFEQELSRLEATCADNPAFIDRAAHILLHADCAR